MGNKEDWEEIEKYIQDTDMRKREEYKGLDIKENLKRVNDRRNNSNVKKVLKISKNAMKIIKIFFAILIIFCIYIACSLFFGNLISSHDVDVEKDIENRNNIEVTLISKNVNDKEQFGEYYFKVKKCPDIQFKAIKYFAQEKDDLSDNLHKYLFENWNNSNKDKFIIDETITDDGLLSYKTYIEINNYDDLLEKTELIIQFLEYSENWSKDNGKVIKFYAQKEGQFIYPITQIFLKKGENIIAPYNGYFQTAEDIRKNAKDMYNKMNSERQINRAGVLNLN